MKLSRQQLAYPALGVLCILLVVRVLSLRDPGAFDPTLSFRALGELLAEEAARAAPERGQAVILEGTFAGPEKPGWKSLHATLRKRLKQNGFTIGPSEPSEPTLEDTLTPTLPHMRWDDLETRVRKYRDAGVIICLGGAPAPPAAPPSPPKDWPALICLEQAGDGSAGRSLVQAGWASAVVTGLVLSEPDEPLPPPKTIEACIERYYRVIRSTPPAR